MYTAWELPTSLDVGGVGRAIRTDFRACLDVLKCLSDPTYEDDEKTLILLEIMYVDLDEIPKELYKEAVEKVVEFLDAGIRRQDTKKQRPTLMDWEQDAPLIIPAVNHVLGQEIRSIPYDPVENTGGLHWWTFIGAYMEVRESLYSSFVEIRKKKAERKKLEKWEEKFYQDNKHLIDIQRLQTHNTEEQKNAARELIFGHRAKQD